MRRLRGIPEDGTKFWNSSQSGRCVQQIVYNSKLPMELLVQYDCSLTLTWCSTPQQLPRKFPQGSPLSPVLFNVDTKGLTGLSSTCLDGCSHLQWTASSTKHHTIVIVVQEQLEGVKMMSKMESETSGASSKTSSRAQKAWTASDAPGTTSTERSWCYLLNHVNSGTIRGTTSQRLRRDRRGGEGVRQSEDFKSWKWSADLA